MCVVEQKTYYQPDGSQKAFDRVHRCDTANQPGAPVCSNATRTSGAARIVEIKPETTTSSSQKKDEVVIDNNGRTRIYRDIGRRSSHKHKTGHSKRSDDRSSLDGRPSAFDTFKTRQPSPVSRPTTPSSAPPRMDSFPPTIRSEPSVRVNRSGTAVYDLPPPLNMPRASENERRKVSFEHDSADRPRFERRPERRPSLKVHIGGPRSGDVPPMKLSPGLSRLPSLRQTHKRTDSAHDHPTRDSSPIYYNDREYADREAARETARRQKALDEAILRRQEDLEALENAQLDREAKRAQDRRSLDPLNRLPDTLYPPRTPQEGSWSRNTSPPTLPSHSRPTQTRTRFASSSPLSPHTTHSRRNYGHTIVHQYHYPDTPTASSRRPSDSIRERGREVIERERARAAAAAAAAEDHYPAAAADENARASERHWESEPVFDEVEERITGHEYYHVSEGSARSEIRRRRDRDDSRRREERRDEFFR
jgi:hypothetical protein